LSPADIVRRLTLDDWQLPTADKEWGSFHSCASSGTPSQFAGIKVTIFCVFLVTVNMLRVVSSCA